MKKIAISCIIAVLLCGCVENPQNTNDEKSEMTSHSDESSNITSKITVTTTSTVCTTVSTEKTTEKIEESTEVSETSTETAITANEDISSDTTVDIMQESEETTISETKPDVIELPFVPAG